MAPEEFLGYPLGERFTRHHRVVDYFEHVSETMPNVKFEKYGETYEHRPLITVTLSSQKNMDNLEAIRTDNLKRTGMIDGAPSSDRIAIVWLSYNVHGNEASSIEAAMLTLYALLDPENVNSKKWLENTVVIIDPCINPDGRDRYANFYNQYGNKEFNPNVDDLEHREVWPGGRPNHYLFDLNRDWAWQTQQESIQRLEAYHKWMPHIHADFHEQGFNNPYYFAPAAEPYNEVITPWQRELEIAIGKNHAKHFDENNWLYFTRERFDLLYPSYGDTYPMFNGAIGMTYEQAGHGLGGLGITTEYGDTLTLSDRIAHHFTTGMSTVEVASANADKMVSEFENNFTSSAKSPSAKYKAYVIKHNGENDKINRLIALLDKNKIQYGSTSTKTAKGFSYLTNSSKSVNIQPKDLVISAYQPKSKLLTSMFEPKTKLSDSLTYDITAWSIPHAYGLDAYALSENIKVSAYKSGQQTEPLVTKRKPYAYISKYNSLDDAKWMAQLHKDGFKLRVAKKAFRLEGKMFDRGSIVVTRRNNERLGNHFDRLIIEHSDKSGRNVTPVYTGFSDSGTDLGSSDIARLKTPKVALLTGPQTSSLNVGEIWYFFERDIDYPITKLSTDYFKSVSLDKYDVLIVPSGYYSLFDDSERKRMISWVNKGGKLILIGRALRTFKGMKGIALKEVGGDNSKADKLQRYEDQERDNLTKSIFGAVFKVSLDNSNPLAYGYGNDYFSLKTSNSTYAFLDRGGNVGVLKGKAIPASGFAGYKAIEGLENSLVFGVENKGSGQMIYMVDNPLFRSFWENGKLLFANAVFMVGN